MRGAWVAGLLLFATAAWADPKAEVKAGTGVENRELVGAADKFKDGETVFVWSSVTDADGTKVQHVWKHEGKEVFKVGFDVKSKRWRTNSRRQKPQKGAWVVEVQKEDGSKIGEVAFTVE